jgi:hypothetical protein
MGLRAAEDDEDALVARAFSRPCRHSCRHLGVEVGLDAARVGACATRNRVFKGVPMALRATKGRENRGRERYAH